MVPVLAICSYLSHFITTAANSDVRCPSLAAAIIAVIVSPCQPHHCPTIVFRAIGILARYSIAHYVCAYRGFDGRANFAAGVGIGRWVSGPFTANTTDLEVWEKVVGFVAGQQGLGRLSLPGRLAPEASQSHIARARYGALHCPSPCSSIQNYLAAFRGERST